jgi:hypothetical protein
LTRTKFESTHLKMAVNQNKVNPHVPQKDHEVALMVGQIRHKSNIQ